MRGMQIVESGHVGVVEKYLQKSKTLLLSNTVATAKEFCEDVEGPASSKDASGDNCYIHHANIYSCHWPSWLVLVFNIPAGLLAECQELIVRGQSCQVSVRT